MRISVYESLPNCAREIRTEVFVEEQGFQEEFDGIDHTAAHIVLFDDVETPAATCRIFRDETMGTYILGRLAVRKEYRGKNMGSAVIRAAEDYVKKIGGTGIALHAQCRAANFYKKSGFREFGSVEDDQGCPHIWMKKSL